MNLECIALFIYEMGFIIFDTFIDKNYINDSLIYSMNEFIYKRYKEDKQSLELLFPDMDTLDKLIKNRTEVIDIDIVLLLLDKYPSINSYLSLVDTISKEKDAIINNLVLSYFKYCLEIYDLMNAENVGYQRILQ